jgi:hypothetical protein
MSLKLNLCVTISYLQIRRPCLNPFQSCLDLEIRFRQSFVIEHNTIHITYSTFESLFIKINSYLLFSDILCRLFLSRKFNRYIFLHFFLDYWHDKHFLVGKLIAISLNDNTLWWQLDFGAVVSLCWFRNYRNNINILYIVLIWPFLCRNSIRRGITPAESAGQCAQGPRLQQPSLQILNWKSRLNQPS